MKEKFEIENYLFEIREAVDVLKCFNEFCDESILPESASDESRKINAICFVRRLGTQRALLTTGIKNLEKTIQEMSQKYNL